MKYLAYICTILPAWLLAIYFMITTYKSEHYYGLAIGMPIAAVVYTIIIMIAFL